MSAISNQATFDCICYSHKNICFCQTLIFTYIELCTLIMGHQRLAILLRSATSGLSRSRAYAHQSRVNSDFSCLRPVFKHTDMHTYIYTNIHTVHSCIHTHTQKPTCIQTCIHAYILANINKYTCIHTWIYRLYLLIYIHTFTNTCTQTFNVHTYNYTPGYLCIEWKLIEFHVLKERSIDPPPFNDRCLFILIKRQCVPDGLLRLSIDVFHEQLWAPVVFPVRFLRLLAKNIQSPLVTSA